MDRKWHKAALRTGDWGQGTEHFGLSTWRSKLGLGTGDWGLGTSDWGDRRLETED